MGSRFTKGMPEYVYFWGSGEWINGPYVRPQKGRDNIKFKLTEVVEDPEWENKVSEAIDRISNDIMATELIKFLETINGELEMGLNSDDISEYVDNYLKKS